MYDQSVTVEKIIMSKQLKALNAVETYTTPSYFLNMLKNMRATDVLRER